MGINFNMLDDELEGYQTIPVQRLVFNSKSGHHQISSQPTSKFIKGPIPLKWITLANALPGKAGAIGIALWFLAGVQNSKVIKLTGEIEKIAACNRKSVYSGLERLEKAKLIKVNKKKGCRPIVSICVE